jgi:hypothetical protein
MYVTKNSSPVYVCAVLYCASMFFSAAYFFVTSRSRPHRLVEAKDGCFHHSFCEELIDLDLTACD